jgi:hypothetical protein
MQEQSNPCSASVSDGSVFSMVSGNYSEQSENVNAFRKDLKGLLDSLNRYSTLALVQICQSQALD